MGTRKEYSCRKEGCHNGPYLGGLCRAHYEQDEKRRLLRADALTALHSGVIDGDLPCSPQLRDELNRLQVYWGRISTVVQTRRGTPATPLDEAEYATEWCISLAEEIVKAERQILAGKEIPTSLTFTQQWVWERLENLDAGRRSNGTRRE